MLGLLCLAFVRLRFIMSSDCLSRFGYGTLKLLDLSIQLINPFHPFLFSDVGDINLVG